MKRILDFFSLIIIVLMCTCTTEQLDLSNYNNDEFNSYPLELELTVDNETRGVKENTFFDEGDAVLVRIDKFNNGIEHITSKATYHDGKWVFEKPFNLSEILDSESYNYVEVYYPYEACSQMYYGNNNSLECKQIDLEEDYLYGIAGLNNNGDGIVKVTMNHCASRVTFKISNNTESPIDLTTLNLISISPSYKKDGTLYGLGDWFCYNCYISSRLSMVSQINDTTHIKDISKMVGSINVNNSLGIGETVTINLFLPPTNLIYSIWEKDKEYITEFTGVRFSLFANGGEYIFEVTPNWEAGKMYTYPLSFSGEELKMPQKVYLGFDSSNGNKLYWSDVNVGVSESYPCGKEYRWGDNTGLRQELYYYSTYISWLQTGVLSNEQDLAHAAFGGTWRTPSSEEFEKLMENCTVSISEKNGYNGYLFTSNINGNSIFFPIPIDHSKKLNIMENYSYYNSKYNNIWAEFFSICDYDNIIVKDDQYISATAFIRPVCE